MAKAENLNDAIVAKVKSILDNTKSITHLYMSIEGNVGEIPQIRYNITENIVPLTEEEIEQNKSYYEITKEVAERM